MIAKKMKVALDDGELVEMTIFAQRAKFLFGYGINENGSVVIAKIGTKTEPHRVVDTTYIRQFRRGEASSFATWKKFHGSTEVHNFFHKHDLPEEGQAHVTARVERLWKLYPQATLLFIPGVE